MPLNWSWSGAIRVLAILLLGWCAPVVSRTSPDAGEADWAQAQLHRQRALSGGADARVHEQQHLAALRRATLAGHVAAAAELGTILLARSEAAGADDPRAARMRADGEALLQLAAEAGDQAAASRFAGSAPGVPAAVADAPETSTDIAAVSATAEASVPVDPATSGADTEHTAAAPPSPASIAHGRGLDALRAADFRVARRHFARAADAGHAAAHNNLGLMWWRGLGGPVDVARALGHLQRASALGHLSATENLALAYQFGVDVPADAMRAIGFWQVAEQRGSTRAASALAALGMSSPGEALPPVAQLR